MLRGCSANGVAGFGCYGHGCEAEQGGGCWDTKGAEPPSPLCKVSREARGRQGTGAGGTDAAETGSFSWETHGHNLLKCFLR